MKKTSANNVIVSIMLVLLFSCFLISGNVYIYNKQYNSLYNAFSQAQQTELKLLTHLAKESLISEDYSLIEWYFNRWGKDQTYVISLTLKNKSGFAVVDYQRVQAAQAEIITHSSTINLQHDHYRIVLLSEITDVETQLNSLLKQLILVSSIVVTLLGIGVWFVFQNLAIKPLLHEIELRHKAEQELKKNQRNLQHIAHHDHLTGLPNRLLFSDRLEQAILKANRSGQAFALFFIDLDQFKQINDSAGHSCGDKVLIHIAENLKKCIRADDTIARIGGDEFTLILSSFNNTADISAVACKVLQAAQKPLTVENKNYQLTVSIGICTYPDNANSIRSLMQKADLAMYQVKQHGRNAFQFCL